MTEPAIPTEASSAQRSRQPPSRQCSLPRSSFDRFRLVAATAVTGFRSLAGGRATARLVTTVVPTDPYNPLNATSWVPPTVPLSIAGPPLRDRHRWTFVGVGVRQRARLGPESPTRDRPYRRFEHAQANAADAHHPISIKPPIPWPASRLTASISRNAPDSASVVSEGPSTSVHTCHSTHATPPENVTSGGSAITLRITRPAV